MSDEVREGAEQATGAEAPGETALAEPDDGLTPRERRELRHRLKRQRQRVRRTYAALILGGLVALAAFMYLFWPLMAGRLAAVEKVDQAKALLDQARPTVDDIDKVVAKQLSPRVDAGVPDVAPQLLVARRELKQAASLIDEAMPHLTDDEQKRARAILDAAEARLVMVDRTPTILATSVMAAKAKVLVDQAVKASQSASSTERIASANYATGRASLVASASVGLQRAKGLLGDARTLYSQAATAFPSGRFERYAAHLALRAQAVRLLSQAASEWLAGDTANAAADYAAYKRAAAKAASAFVKLPSASAAPGQAFRKVAGKASDAYTKAKHRALEADTALEGL